MCWGWGWGWGWGRWVLMGAWVLVGRVISQVVAAFSHVGVSFNIFKCYHRKGLILSFEFLSPPPPIIFIVLINTDAWWNWIFCNKYKKIFDPCLDKFHEIVSNTKYCFVLLFLPISCVGLRKQHQYYWPYSPGALAQMPCQLGKCRKL